MQSFTKWNTGEHKPYNFPRGSESDAVSFRPESNLYDITEFNGIFLERYCTVFFKIKHTFYIGNLHLKTSQDRNIKSGYDHT